MKFKDFLVIVVVICSVQCQKLSEVQHCGRKFRAISNRIFGGDEVKSNSWPWLVAFVHQPFETFFCSGSLVSSKHVISAAHCFKNKLQVDAFPPQYIAAHVGKHNLSNVNELGSTEHSVWEIILHPDWDSEDVRFDADISVVVLSDHVKFSEKVKLICLPLSSDVEVVGTGTVVGWGKSERSEEIGEDFDPTPSQLEIPAVDSFHCVFTVPQLNDVVSKRTFCAGFVNESKAPCTGDSGGGFYRRNPLTELFEIKGIVSASLVDTVTYRGCNIEVFSLYTNVAKFTDWIGNKVEETKEIVWEEVKFDCKEDSQREYNFTLCSHNHPGPMTRNLKIRPNFSNHPKIKNAADVNQVELIFRTSAHIFAGIHETFPNLKQLTIAFQPIKFIVKEDFAGLIQLEELSLNNNKIEFLPENVFSNLLNLNILRLANNQIKVLSEEILKVLRQLKTIDLSDNKIKHLPKDLFADNLELEVIAVQRNPLKTIDVDFTKLPNLLWLSLKNSKCIDLIADNEVELQEAQQIINRNCTSSIW